MTDIRGYVLAGGRSSRMGSDKALLQIEQHSAIERQCDLLESSCPQGVFIAGATSKELHQLRWPVIQDATQDQGPISGIIAALQHAQDGIAVIIAVDLVALERSDIEELTTVCSKDLNSQFDVFFAQNDRDLSEHGAQPLCAAWRADTSLSVLTQQFASNQRSVMKSWLGLKRHGVSIPDSHLININSPLDFENFRQTKG